MAKFAFRDAARTQMVYAVEAKQEDNEIWYYCPILNVNAHLYVSSRDGVRVPYFRAKYSRYGHTKGCKYGPDKDHRIDLAKYNEAAFDFKSAISSMEQLLAPTRRKLYPGRHKEGKSTGRSAIRTIKDIYSMCKEIGVGGEYNGLQSKVCLWISIVINIITGVCMAAKLLNAQHHHSSITRKNCKFSYTHPHIN